MFAARTARVARTSRVSVRRYATQPPLKEAEAPAGTPGKPAPVNPLILVAGAAAAIAGYFYVTKKDAKTDAEKIRDDARALGNSMQTAAQDQIAVAGEVAADARDTADKKLKQVVNAAKK